MTRQVFAGRSPLDHRWRVKETATKQGRDTSKTDSGSIKLWQTFRWLLSCNHDGKGAQSACVIADNPKEADNPSQVRTTANVNTIPDGRHDRKNLKKLESNFAYF